MNDDCCQLHTHSSLSFKDGLNTEKDLVARAAELGQPGIGLTNHGNLYGAPRFFKACKEQGIKGIIGMEIYEAVPEIWDPDPDGPHVALFKEKWDPDKPRYHHLTLWALDLLGWENLCALHSMSYTAAYKPRNQPLVDRASLARHSNGLIVGLGCPQSRTNWQLTHHGIKAATDAAGWYVEVFGRDQVICEVMSATSDQVRSMNDQRAIAKHLGIDVVGTNDVHYVLQEDGAVNAAHHMLVQARKFGSSASAEAKSSDKSDEAYGDWYGSDQFYIKTRAEMIQSGVFANEVDKTLEILERSVFDFGSMPEPRPPVAHIPAPGVDPAFDNWLAIR